MGVIQLDLSQSIAQIRSKPLLVLCRTIDGSEIVTTAESCQKMGATFIHIVADELDALLAETLSDGISGTIKDPAETPRSVRRHNV